MGGGDVISCEFKDSLSYRIFHLISPKCFEIVLHRPYNNGPVMAEYERRSNWCHFRVALPSGHV